MDLSVGEAAARATTAVVDPSRYAIGGRVPRAALRPGSREEVADALARAARDDLAVIPWGGGTWLPADASPDRYDLALDLSALDRIVEYEPEDMTITAECGVSLATLRATLAERRQELPLEGGLATRATLGGVLACNASGPRRLRFGAPYDRLMGARFALGDGTIARSGGRVVKNVAGYAIHRLLCGSRGGLAVLLEASLKLAPGPERRVLLEYQRSAAELVEPARWAPLPRLEPAAVTVSGDGAGFVVSIALEDEASWVEQQEAAVTRALGAPAGRLEGASVTSRLQELADRAAGAAVGSAAPSLELVTSGSTPAALAPLLEAEPRATFVFHASAGRLHLVAAAERVASLVPALAAGGFTLIAARGAEITPAFPSSTALRALRARIREAIDPGPTFALGERWLDGR